MRTVCAVSVARSDWGLLLPVLRSIRDEPGMALRLVAGGAHLDPDRGHTLAAVEADGFRPDRLVPCSPGGDAAVDCAEAMGMAVSGFGRALAELAPELVLVLGDRWEMHAAALAALPLGLPVAHVHGGELTLGAMDDALRHSMTKLSHLHFTSTAEYARRVVRLGEEPWRVTVSGAPGLDALSAVEPLDAGALSGRHGFDFSRPFVLATWHPETVGADRAAGHARAFLEALGGCGLPVVFTGPNADPGGLALRDMLHDFLRAHPRCAMVENFGTAGYAGAMRLAACMAGNTSSGILEAASFGLPVVNVGARQEGRVRGANVVDAEPEAVAVADALQRALAPGFRDSLRGMANPYGDGRAAGRIAARLRDEPLGPRLLAKRFHDGPCPPMEEPWA